MKKKDRIIIKELTEDGLFEDIVEDIDDFFFISKVSTVDALGFVWDDCHKIYIVEDEDDIQSVRETWNKDETIYKLDRLPEIWSRSCPLRFISNWKLDKDYVSQCNCAMFEFPLWEDE